MTNLSISSLNGLEASKGVIIVSHNASETISSGWHVTAKVGVPVWIQVASATPTPPALPQPSTIFDPLNNIQVPVPAGAQVFPLTTDLPVQLPDGTIATIPAGTLMPVTLSTTGGPANANLVESFAYLPAGMPINVNAPLPPAPPASVINPVTGQPLVDPATGMMVTSVPPGTDMAQLTMPIGSLPAGEWVPIMFINNMPQIAIPFAGIMGGTPLEPANINMGNLMAIIMPPPALPAPTPGITVNLIPGEPSPKLTVGIDNEHYVDVSLLSANTSGTTIAGVIGLMQVFNAPPETANAGHPVFSVTDLNGNVTSFALTDAVGNPVPNFTWTQALASTYTGLVPNAPALPDLLGKLAALQAAIGNAVTDNNNLGNTTLNALQGAIAGLDNQLLAAQMQCNAMHADLTLTSQGCPTVQEFAHLMCIGADVNYVS